MYKSKYKINTKLIAGWKGASLAGKLGRAFCKRQHLIFEGSQKTEITDKRDSLFKVTEGDNGKAPTGNSE